MWVAKIKIEGRSSIVGGTAGKTNVSGVGYPISSRHSGNEISIFFIASMSGADSDKNNFIDSIRKNPRTVHVEREGDFIVSQIIEHIDNDAVYDAHLIHIEPVVIKSDGSEYWTLGSWEKKYLINFIKAVEKFHKVELLSIKYTKIKNFSFVSSNPPLSDKQKSAMELAVREGYYKYPRKVGIRKLAKISGISYSTFQAHLRKAEMKLIPFSLNKAF